MNKQLKDLNIGDKFQYAELPYLVIDMDFKNMSLYTDFSNIIAVLSLTSLKVLGFSADIKVTLIESDFAI
jgi:hypothetical protein